MADNSFDILIEQANQAIQENNLEAALELLKTASAQKPDDAGVFTGIGKIYLQFREDTRRCEFAATSCLIGA